MGVRRLKAVVYIDIDTELFYRAFPSQYQYKRKFEESKGHYLMIPDTPESLHHREASELQSHVSQTVCSVRGSKPVLPPTTPTFTPVCEVKNTRPSHLSGRSPSCPSWG